MHTSVRDRPRKVEVRQLRYSAGTRGIWAIPYTVQVKSFQLRVEFSRKSQLFVRRFNSVDSGEKANVFSILAEARRLDGLCASCGPPPGSTNLSPRL